MASTKRVKKKQNFKTRQQKKCTTKSKYFNETKINSKRVKQAVKNIDKKTRLKSEKEVPILSVTNGSKHSNTDVNPRIFGKRLTRDFFDTPTEILAVALLGKILCRKATQGRVLQGKIVETEAYLGEIDPACHSYGGKRTARNAPMYGPPGTAYVYFIYGMYHCFNISSKEAGACVLIRALEPISGHTEMRQFRDAKRKETAKQLKDHELANGPSKLCTALDITKDKLNNTDMTLSNQFWIEDSNLSKIEDFSVVHTTRIGIDSYGKDAAQMPYRYYILDNKHVSIQNKNAESKMT